MSGLIINLETSMPAMSRTPKTRASAPPKPSTLCFTNLPEASTYSEGNHCIALQKESLSSVFLPDVTAFTKNFKHYQAVQFSSTKALSTYESWYIHSCYSNFQSIYRHKTTWPTWDRYHLIEIDMQSKIIIISIKMLTVYKVHITSKKVTCKVR